MAVKLSHCFLPRGAFKVVFEQHGFLLENREARKGGVYSAAQSTLIQNAAVTIFQKDKEYCKTLDEFSCNKISTHNVSRIRTMTHIWTKNKWPPNFLNLTLIRVQRPAFYLVQILRLASFVAISLMKRIFLNSSSFRSMWFDGLGNSLSRFAPPSIPLPRINRWLRHSQCRLALH